VLRVQTSRLYAGKILNLLITLAGMMILLFTQRSVRAARAVCPAAGPAGERGRHVVWSAAGCRRLAGALAGLSLGFVRGAQ
jgi:hypothetical protein